MVDCIYQKCVHPVNMPFQSLDDPCKEGAYISLSVIQTGFLDCSHEYNVSKEHIILVIKQIVFIGYTFLSGSLSVGTFLETPFKSRGILRLLV